jgi:hypothetical protein
MILILAPSGGWVMGMDLVAMLLADNISINDVRPCALCPPIRNTDNSNISNDYVDNNDAINSGTCYEDTTTCTFPAQG